MITEMNGKLTLRELSRLLKLPGASKGQDPSSVASMSIKLP